LYQHFSHRNSFATNAGIRWKAEAWQQFGETLLSRVKITVLYKRLALFRIKKIK